MTGASFRRRSTIERKTALKLFPGQYSAEYRYATLVRNGNHAFRPIVIPGTAASADSILLGDLDITADISADQRVTNASGTLYMYPPRIAGREGWLARMNEAAVGSRTPSIFVRFGAGSTIPEHLMEIVAITVRWHYDQRDEDRKLLADQYELWHVRDAS